MKENPIGNAKHGRVTHRPRWTVLFVATVLGVLALPVHGQEDFVLTESQIRQLNAIATRDVPENAPGIATGVIWNGKIVFKKCAGLADLENETAISADSRFNIASNGKQFTAFAINLLVSEGKLALSDDVRKHLPGLYPHVESAITVQNLLTHTSGIRDVYDLWALQGLTWWEHSFGNQDALKLLQKQNDLNFPPGQRYLYSNSNYILLAEIVAAVSGKSFVQYTDEMFQNLSMDNTSFVENCKAIQAPIAKPYFNFQTWTGYDWIWNIHGDGNVFSSLNDQLEWELAVQGAKKVAIDNRRIQASQQKIEGVSDINYGYGLEFDTYKGTIRRFHSGGTGAWKAYTVRFPERKLSIVTLSNSGKTDVVGQSLQMADALLRLKSKKAARRDASPNLGQRVSDNEILGTYVNDQGTTFQFLEAKNKLTLRRSGRADVLLEREADNIFRQVFDPTFQQAFKTNERGEMQVTVYHPSHAPYTLTRLSNDWGKFDYQTVEGTFVNSETGVEFVLSHIEGQDYEVKMKNRTRSAVLVTPTKLIVGNYVLERPKNSTTPDQWLLQGNRIRNVKFLRSR